MSNSRRALLLAQRLERENAGRDRAYDLARLRQEREAIEDAFTNDDLDDLAAFLERCR